VSLKIFNVLAQQVAVPVLQGGVTAGQPLENVFLTCGEYTAYWDGMVRGTNREAASGIYSYRLEVNGSPITRKMTIGSKTFQRIPERRPSRRRFCSGGGRGPSGSRWGGRTPRHGPDPPRASSASVRVRWPSRRAPSGIASRWRPRTRIIRRADWELAQGDHGLM
jgi:hypothetical protein